MRKLFIILFFIHSFLTYAQDTLTILHVNDTHSMLAPKAPRNSELKGTQGGIARAASIIGLTKTLESNVLTLHGGDAFIGDLFFNKYYGVAEFRLMNAIGFDVMCLGNHEFDLGPSTLLTAFDSSLADGGFSVISSNLNLEDAAVQPLKKYVKPYTIKQFGNLKIGIFSLLTPGTNYVSNPSPAVVDADILTVITKTVATLLSKGCNFIICMSHLGIDLDKTVAAAAPYINVIISAHDHIVTEVPVEVKNPLGKSVLIVQANALYSHIGKLKVVVDNGNIVKSDYSLITLDQTVPEEPTVAGIVDILIAGIETDYGKVYTQQCATATGYFEEEAKNLNEAGMHDTPIGNLVTDAFRWKTGTNVAMTVGGATAMPIYAGSVVPADLFRVIGYGFNTVNGLGYRIVKIKMTGAYLWATIEAAVSATDIISNDELLPQVSGMTYFFSPKNPMGSRIEWIKINGLPLIPTATYSVTTNELLLYEMDNLFKIPYSDAYLYQDSTEFQVLLDYVTNVEHGIISPYTDGRVSLSVELYLFDAKLVENRVLLSWQTTYETGNKGFEIERKTNDDWKRIGYVNGNGNTLQFHSYTFSDNINELTSFGVIHYRLKQTNYDGTYKYSKEISIDLTPTGYSLSQNYPNPFNPITTIAFSLPERKKVTLKIFNSIGEEVTNLVDEIKEAGNYRINWNASGVASGVYFYRLQATPIGRQEGSFIDTKKLVLLK